MSLLHWPASKGHGAQYAVWESAKLLKLLYTDNLQTAHVIRAVACERGYPYILEKMQKQGPEKGAALGLHKKRHLFPGDRTAKPKTAARFWFCISDIRLISERGRRRTDYLRGIRLSSGLHLFRHCIRMQPFMFRRRLPERAGLSRTRDYNR